MMSQKYSMILKFCPRPKLAKFESFLLLAIANVATSQNQKNQKPPAHTLGIFFWGEISPLDEKRNGLLIFQGFVGKKMPNISHICRRKIS
jgi:hypothetical protein